MPARDCSKTGCADPAVSSLTFVYEDSTLVVGPLARTADPNAYDLCETHAARMTPPRGWEMIRVTGSADAVDDLVALAAAVDPREQEEAPLPPAPSAQSGAQAGGGRHLHVVRPSDES
ncbi:DUF3499 domain-containing protein [Brachybacterium endophyticum]|uniref:DUF3499 domain-containing protein n=1 Tax=Brachybacterium endophyticum TaxID=2182385 RepID=UPI001F0B8754|nr:DUF3499 domain-containing protein [Brachybacterium endophyticum]